MVLLVDKFARLCSKLESRGHHHKHEELSSSLHAFKSYISEFIGQLAPLSLSSIRRCFGLLPMMNKAFLKLVVDIDFPMSQWEDDSIQVYLNHTLTLLELLNSISCSLSSLRHARLSLAHGLTNPTSLATKHQIKAVKPARVMLYEQPPIGLYTKDNAASQKRRGSSGRKEAVVREALKEMKSIELWICGVLLSGLCSDCKPYMELREVAADGGFASSLSEELLAQEMPIFLFSEVKQINIAVGELVANFDDDAAQELQRQVHNFETMLDALYKEVDDLFANVMVQRSELIALLPS